MRRNWFAGRLVLLGVLILICIGLIGLSASGIIRPFEDLFASPLAWASNIISGTSSSLINGDSATLTTVDDLENRNAELERQLAQLQGELISLREIAADYDRLTELLDYVNSTENLDFLTADVIGRGQYGFINSIIINKGTRDGLTIGMPVTTELGMVGRIWRVTANTAQVQLITDRNSFVSARLQESRAEGTIRGRGLDTGAVELILIPLEVNIERGELLYTSGRGGNFPADLPLGVVVSVSNVESELTQEAQVSSLVDFTTLEQVLVITNFEPADLSSFENPEQ
ncbi:MAG: rod shape-determining protein MreC [Phototrophicaceae bacterium]